MKAFCSTFLLTALLVILSLGVTNCSLLGKDVERSTASYKEKWADTAKQNSILELIDSLFGKSEKLEVTRMVQVGEKDGMPVYDFEKEKVNEKEAEIEAEEDLKKRQRDIKRRSKSIKGRKKPKAIAKVDYNTDDGMDDSYLMAVEKIRLLKHNKVSKINKKRNYISSNQDADFHEYDDGHASVRNTLDSQLVSRSDGDKDEYDEEMANENRGSHTRENKELNHISSSHDADLYKYDDVTSFDNSASGIKTVSRGDGGKDVPGERNTSIALKNQVPHHNQSMGKEDVASHVDSLDREVDVGGKVYITKEDLVSNHSSTKFSDVDQGGPKLYAPELKVDLKSRGKKGAVQLVWTKYNGYPDYQVEIIREGRVFSIKQKWHVMHIMVYWDQDYLWRARVLNKDGSAKTAFAPWKPLRVTRNQVEQQLVKKEHNEEDHNSTIKVERDAASVLEDLQFDEGGY